MEHGTGRSCPGTVVVHTDGAVTCTANECSRRASRWLWFGMHGHFVRCVDSIGGTGCADCGFHPIEQRADQQVAAPSGSSRR